MRRRGCYFVGVFLCFASGGQLSANSGRRSAPSCQPISSHGVAWKPGHFLETTSLYPPQADTERCFPKNAGRNPWFLHFLRHLQELLPQICRSRELVCFYSRCRCIGRLKKLAILSWGTDCHIKKVEGNWGRWKFSHKIILSFRAGAQTGRWNPYFLSGRCTRPFLPERERQRVCC